MEPTPRSISFRLLHLNNSYLDTPLYQNLYDALSALGVESWVHLTFRNRNRELAEEYRGRAGYSMTEVSSSRLMRLLVYPKIRRVYQDVLPVVDAFQPDLVHAHSLLSDGLVAYRLKKALGLPYMVAFRYTDEVMLRVNKALIRDARRVLMGAERVIFISPSHVHTALGYLKGLNKAHLLKKYYIIPNGIDSYWFTNKGEVRKLSGDTLRLLYVGEIIPRKNILLTVEAVRVLNEQGVDASLTIVGWNEKTADKYARGVKKRCEAYPFIRMVERTNKREELLALYREADVYVMPSFGETFGLTYVEAMSQGLPVICSTGQGIFGYYEEGQIGYSVDPKDVNDLVDKILKIRKKYYHFSRRALKNSDNFKWEVIGRVYWSLIKNQIKTEACPRL